MNVIFFGTPDFAVFSLKALIADPNVDIKLVVTQPDRAAGRGGSLRSSPVKQVAAANEVPVLQPLSIKKDLDGFLSEAKAYGPFDIGIVSAYGQILPQAVLDLPQQGCLNIHASLLPKWRGAAPIQRAIIAGDKETGVCLMKMELALDTGPVWSKSIIPIADNDNLETLHDKLGALGAKLLTQDLAAIVKGEKEALPQGVGGLSYAKKIEASEAKIDWSKGAEEIARLIRGLSPFPGAYCNLDGKRLKIFSAAAKDMPEERGEPGNLAYLDRSRLEVHCGTGQLEVKELQLEGKKRLATEDFLRGFKIAKDVKL